MLPETSDTSIITIQPENVPRRNRKNQYVPNLAAANFKPTEDWTIEQARERYEKASFPFAVDCIKEIDCVLGMQKLPSESIDLVIADPPFGLDFTGKESIYNRDARFVRRGYQEIRNNYKEFSHRWIQELPRIMKHSASAWIFSGWTNLGDILDAIARTSLTIINHIIWKYQFGVFTRRKFVTSHYHILFLVKSKDYYFNKVEHYPLDVWEIKRTYRRGETKNSTKLPGRLIQKCVDFASRPGDLVMDPFMGNGTTAVVAKGTFRHYLGFEINKSMKEVHNMDLRSIKVGELYEPYTDREDEIVSRAKLKYGKTKRLDAAQLRIERYAE